LAYSTENNVVIERAMESSSAPSWRTWFHAFLLALLLYGFTLAPGLLWGDSGEAQLHVLFDDWFINREIARSHVLYYAFARFLHHGLSLEAALSANLISALGGACTIANFAWILATLCRSRIAVVSGAILMAFSHSHWRLSAVAEVMTLTTALLTAEWMCFLKLIDGRNPRWLLSMMFLNGLGVSNHNLAMLMWPVYAAMTCRWHRSWKAAIPKPLCIAFAGILALLLGMTPVLLLCADHWRTQGSLIETLKSFLFGEYGRQALNLSGIPRLLLRSLAVTVMNFPTPLILLAVPGWLAFRRSSSPTKVWYFFGTFLLFTAFGARYDVVDQHTFLIPTFLLLVLMTSFGIQSLLMRSSSAAVPLTVCGLAMLAPMVYAGAPPLLRRYDPTIGPMPQRAVPHRDRLDWFLRPWLRGYDGAARYARETLTSLPENAWLVVDSTLCPPLNYVQVRHSLRMDVRLDSWMERQPWFDEFEDEATRPRKLTEGLLFVASDDPGYLPDWLHGPGFVFEPFGNVFRVRPSNVR